MYQKAHGCGKAPHMNQAKVLGLVGWSGSGKTTLIIKLIPELNRRGLKVATLKHAHHNFDVDKPGKDSYEHRKAGASEVIVSSALRWAQMHEVGDGKEATLAELLQRCRPVTWCWSRDSRRIGTRSWKSSARKPKRLRSIPGTSGSSPWPAIRACRMQARPGRARADATARSVHSTRRRDLQHACASGDCKSFRA